MNNNPIQFREEQINTYFETLVDHGLIHEDDINMRDGEAREMFSELAVKFMRSMNQKQHTQLQRLV